MFGMRICFGKLVKFVALAFAIMTASEIAALEPATGNVVLTVTGEISVTNAEGAAAFDMSQLESLDAVSFETSTVWTDGMQSFTGVELFTLLKMLGVEDGALRASAVNDYAVDIPVSDAVPGGPIVAYRRNDTGMRLRDKGPLWIVYPYDSSPEYQTELIYSRSIWQLNRIEVLP